MALTTERQNWLDSLLEAYDLNQAERALLSKAAEMLDRADEAARQVEADGPYQTSHLGTPKPHPAIRASLMQRVLTNNGQQADTGACRRVVSPSTANRGRCAPGGNLGLLHGSHLDVQRVGRSGGC